ncbi:MAG: NUDIX domain-containing protein [Candidatus Delongbacteria bacterium]|jgi:ADP-ribose pyrophosphatase YjhB (NUDIX family)|nr:NUDIX domain-containing protein [Candidatus Delongbacteria bacterium]
MNYIKDIRKIAGNALLQMPSVTICTFNEEGKILLMLHRDTDTWVAPGGSIEPGETPADAAVREMHEETGLIVELVSIKGVYGGSEFVVNYPNGDRTSYIMTVFEAVKKGGKLEAIDNEAKELKYFTLEEALKLNTQPWLRSILPKLFNKESKTDFKAAEWEI